MTYNQHKKYIACQSKSGIVFYNCFGLIHDVEVISPESFREEQRKVVSTMKKRY